MRTVDFNGVTYSTGKLPVFEQLHVARKLAPVLAHLIPVFKKLLEAESATAAGNGIEDIILDLAAGPLADILSKMSKEDVEYVVNACLDVCDRKQERGFAKVRAGGTLMFNDIELDTLIGLTATVVWSNLGRFFPTSQPTSHATE
jgi:hypothetical protein